jgi:hypothetical protein
VVASYFSIHAADDERSPLCHFDYERSKSGYPEAHLQVFGESAALTAWEGDPFGRRGLGRLHFPMGGRRYRPILEDVIEFLVAEGLAEARDGWRDVIEAERHEYQQIQLRAAIRRDPDTARSAVAALPSEPAPRPPRRKRRS